MIPPFPLRLAVTIEMMIPKARKLSVRRMRSKGSPGLTFSKMLLNVPLCNTQALKAESSPDGNGGDDRDYDYRMFGFCFTHALL
jgi:hypothetical protein